MTSTARRSDQLSLAQARRVVLAAQGLAKARPAGAVGMRQFMQVVDRLGFLQIDSVNVLARAHLMPLFTRLGDWDVTLLQRASASPPRRLVEYWAHEASFVTPELYRTLGFRQRQFSDPSWRGGWGVHNEHAAVVTAVRDLIAATGPMTSSQVQAVFEVDHPRVPGGWWNWSVAKRALEYLFLTGVVTSAGRTPQFERRYELVERALPAAALALPELSDAEAIRTLVAHAAQVHGVATVNCLRDYYRLRREEVLPAIADLVEEGTLRPVRVEGWNKPAWLHRDAQHPRAVRTSRLLSPFDPLVHERTRLLQLFGMHYRIEIYTPAHLRTYGYYVLPFLHDEVMAARVDLKADRARRVLVVSAAHLEPGAPADTGEALAAELDLMATWLGLGTVEVPPAAPWLPGRRSAT